METETQQQSMHQNIKSSAYFSLNFNVSSLNPLTINIYHNINFAQQ